MTNRDSYGEAGEAIYHFNDKIKKEEENIRNDPDLTEKNKELILTFCNERRLKRKFSPSRVYKLMNKLKLIGRILKKDFPSVTEKDIVSFLETVEDRKGVSSATKDDFCIILRIFYKWLLGGDKEFPSLVADIKPNRKTKKRLPEEILTEEDVAKIINALANPRDKAIAALMADSGCRIGELLMIRFRNLSYQGDGTMRLIIETGKTGGRAFALIPSVPYITQYINSLPDHIRNNKDNFLLTKKHNQMYTDKQMTIASIAQLLRKAAIRAGVAKAVNPHAWRRSSATTSAAFMTDTQLMLRYGWNQRKTIDAYTIMKATQADEAYKIRFGKEVAVKKESLLTPLKCICGTLNPQDSLCMQCGRPNTLKIAVQHEEEQQQNLSLIHEALTILAENVSEEQREKLQALLKGKKGHFSSFPK